MFLEPPKPKGVCPRRNGFFAHPDPAVCNIFYNCIEGEHTEITCTAGLHFDEYSGTCVWPDSAQREGCNAQTSKFHNYFKFGSHFIQYKIKTNRTKNLSIRVILNI